MADLVTKWNEFVSLRHRLRADTRASHDIVDAAFAGYDICELGGYVRFLRAHLSALNTLACGYCIGNKNAIEAETAHLMINLRADLAKLGEPDSTAHDTTSRDYHPLALRYVLLGSRMGMAVLRKRWAQSGDPCVLAASHFLNMPKQPDRWRLFCIELEAHAATGALADKIIADAQTIFFIYAQAGRDLAETLQGPRYEAPPLSNAGASA